MTADHTGDQLGHAPDLDVMHARQARRGRHALMILAASLTLVVLALVVMFAFYAGSLAGLRGNREPEDQTARSVTAQPAPVKQTPAG
jgi:hypothetical protein